MWRIAEILYFDFMFKTVSFKDFAIDKRFPPTASTQKCLGDR